MNFSLIYLVRQFFFRIYQFIHDWYVGSFIKIWHLTLNVLELMDKVFAIKVTFKNLFQPLYGDRSVIGYILGFAFRSLRFLICIFIYPIVIIIATAIYIIWIFIPIYIIYIGFN